MAVPAIVAIDDDPNGLLAAEAQLVERYGRRYRVECRRRPEDGMALLEALGEQGVDLALLILTPAAVRATDGGLLDRARRRHPQAKRVLLVAANVWTDAQAADEVRTLMALGRIDHFVHEPGPPPDEVFHEAIGGFLLEWARERRLVPQTVHIVGREWSGRAYELRATFESCAVPHEFCLADSPLGRELLGKAGPDAQLPIMVLPDGRVLSDPSNAEIAAAAGAPQALDEGIFDLVVIGAGPAGLSAAVYAACDGLRALVVDAGGIGGQARSSSLIRNYLGFAKGVSGGRLAEQAYEQASSFGASFVFMHRVTALKRDGEELAVTLQDGRRIHARTVILATGASYRRLQIPALEALIGAGVFYGGPASEAPSLTGTEVYVVGGGNSAGQAALHLARYARRVSLIVRGRSLAAGMSHYLVQAIEDAPNLVVRTETTVADGGGESHLERLLLRDLASGHQEWAPAQALFVLIGADPLTGWLSPEIERDAAGFLLTGEDVDGAWPLERRPFPLETSMPRLLAAGDIRHGSVKRVAAAVGEGATAVQIIHQVLVDDQQAVGERVTR